MAKYLSSSKNSSPRAWPVPTDWLQCFGILKKIRSLSNCGQLFMQLWRFQTIKGTWWFVTTSLEAELVFFDADSGQLLSRGLNPKERFSFVSFFSMSAFSCIYLCSWKSYAPCPSEPISQIVLHWHVRYVSIRDSPGCVNDSNIVLVLNPCVHIKQIYIQLSNHSIWNRYNGHVCETWFEMHEM